VHTPSESMRAMPAGRSSIHAEATYWDCSNYKRSAPPGRIRAGEGVTMGLRAEAVVVNRGGEGACHSYRLELYR
jgi:hypothetical protein